MQDPTSAADDLATAARITGLNPEALEHGLTTRVFFLPAESTPEHVDQSVEVQTDLDCGCQIVTHVALVGQPGVRHEVPCSQHERA